MKTFSLPKSFYDRICALPPVEMMHLLKAIYNYMYSDGKDTAIDKIKSPKAEEIVKDFKVFAAKKFAARQKARERAAERRLERGNQPQPRRITENTLCFNNLTIKQMRRQMLTDMPNCPKGRLPAGRVLECFNAIYCRWTPKHLRPRIYADFLARYRPAA